MPVPGVGGLLAKSGTFEVVTESEVYAKVRSIARLPLLALTVRECRVTCRTSVIDIPGLYWCLRPRTPFCL